ARTKARPRERSTSECGRRMQRVQTSTTSPPTPQCPFPDEGSPSPLRGEGWVRGAREDSSGGTEDTVKLLSCIVPGMRRQLGWLCVLPVIAALTPNPTVRAATPSFNSAMQTASQARNVPLPLIQAIAYV